MSGPKNAEGVRAAIRKAFETEEQKRNEEFEEQIKRLLRNLDDFERGTGDARSG